MSPICAVTKSWRLLCSRVTGVCPPAANRALLSKMRPVVSDAACARPVAPPAPSPWSALNWCTLEMNPTANIDAVSRRGFFQLTLGWIAAIFAACASAVGAVRFLVPNVLFEPSLVFKAGKPEDYPDGSVTFLEEERVFLVRQGNTFRCLSAICTHLGCTVNRTSQGYHCPCHGSVFDDQGGECKSPTNSGTNC